MIHDLIEVAGTMGEVVELLGVLIIVFGFAYAFFSVSLFKLQESESRLVAFRTAAKKSMLLGLDLLVARDIIRTVTVDPSLSKVDSLGLLVMIRTALVFTIHLETEGRWPWEQQR